MCDILYHSCHVDAGGDYDHDEDDDDANDADGGVN